MESQSLRSKQAESKRPFHGESILEEDRIANLFTQRAMVMLEEAKKLSQKGVSFTPFLEIGAGSVHRSAALVEKYSAEGVASDISLNSLKDTPYVLSLLGYSKAPWLICCDANFLPFAPNTFSFVFAFQTLHHFVNPVPIANECHRVLAKGGHFYFNEEPMDSGLRRFLRGKRVLSHPYTSIQKLAAKLKLEMVFWDDGALERSLGMNEARFDIGLWRKTLSPFNIIELDVNQKLKVRSNLVKPRGSAFFSSLIGGNVRGLCRKEDGLPVNTDFFNRFMCLDCGTFPLGPLNPDSIICDHCGRKYLVEDGILRMFPKGLEEKLFSIKLDD